MAISRPREPVYYYECGGGRFRLVYFMPPEMLQQLQQDGKVRPQVLDDFPDGVDLGCTEPDFADFERSYAYRPPLSPDALRRAFFAIFSTTHDWRSFRGTGFMPAAELEERVGPVEKKLEEEHALPLAESAGAALRLPERRARLGRRRMRQERTQRVLEELPVRGIDAKKSLRQQAFRAIRMKPGEPAEQVFFELHQRSRPAR